MEWFDIELESSKEVEAKKSAAQYRVVDLRALTPYHPARDLTCNVGQGVEVVNMEVVVVFLVEGSGEMTNVGEARKLQ